MPTKFTGGVDLATGEVQNACFQNLASAPTAKTGRFYYNTTSNTLDYHNGTTWVSVTESLTTATFDANTIVKADVDDTPLALAVDLDTIVGRVTGVNGGVISALTAAQTRTFLGSLDLFSAPTSSISMGSQTVTDVADPVDATDAANKAYVDAARSGLSVKDPVRVASTADVTIASPGASIDGVSLSSGDRVLLKDQSTASENGLYEWVGAATPMTRTTDADTSAEMVSGTAVWVNEGTNNADKRYILTTDAPITLDTTALTFTMDSGGGGGVTGTTDRITVTGSQVDIAATYTGQTSITTLGTIDTATWEAAAVGVAYGGTGATDAATARSNLGAVGKYETTIGDGASTSFTVTHSLNTLGITVELYEVATGETVYADVTRTSVNAISVAGFVTAPTTNQYAVVVMG